MRRSVVVGLAVLSVSLSMSIESAAADDAFHAVPPAPHEKGGLELRIESFANGIHGEMHVVVRNPGNDRVDFVASGLYFVPDADGGETPQRLGLVGGARTGVEEAARAVVAIAPGTTRELRFDVYCLDLSRHAPSAATMYTLAPTRMPPKLAAALDASTRPLLAGVFGSPAADVADRVQSVVWATRRQVRTRLFGER